MERRDPGLRVLRTYQLAWLPNDLAAQGRFQGIPFDTTVAGKI